MLKKLYAQKHLIIVCFIILFSWISFFPQPLHDRYAFHARLFYGIFFVLLVLNREYRDGLFSLKDWPLWLFIVSLFSGTANAIDKTVAFKTYWYLAITCFFIFYIGKALFAYENNRNIICEIICVCGCLVVFVGIPELYFGRNIIYEKFVQNYFYRRYAGFRMMSTLSNPTVMGTYMLGCLPFALYLCKGKTIYLKILGKFSIFLFVFAIILTFSRSVLFGLIVLLLFYLWNRKNIRLLFFSIIFLTSFLFFNSCQKNLCFQRLGFKGMVSGAYGSAVSQYRFDRLNMAVKMFKSYPLFGIGLNHFRIRFNEFRSKASDEITAEFMIPDNMYLTFLSETGLIGSLGLLVFIFSIFNRGLNQFKKINDNNKKQRALAILSALAGFLIVMCGYELFYWDSPYLFFCLICGFISLPKLQT